MNDIQAASLPAAAEWMAAVLTGQLGTSVAILAVAAIGASMFQGRIEVRRGAIRILGCFVVIASGPIARALTSSQEGTIASADAPQPVLLTPSPPAAYNPYTSASVTQ